MNNNLKRDKKKKGFTLIELIIVIAILAILAAIAIPNLTSVRDNAKVKADKASCEVIRRSTLTLIADDQIIVPSTGTKTATLTFTEAGVINTPTYSPDDASATAWKAQEKTDFQDSIKEVKAPQGIPIATSPAPTTASSKATEYVVTIPTSGTVTVVTTN